MFFWTEQSILWFSEAAEYNSFHHDLAKLLLQEIDSGEAVCDLGCGLGYLSVELARGSSSLLAIDSDENALAELKKRQPSNMTIKCADVGMLPMEPFCDTLVLSFFGRITEGDNLERYLSFCKKRLIAVVNSGSQSAISPTGKSKMQKEFSPKIEAFLDERKIPFKLIEAELEFGQPFKTKAAAVEFIQYYAKGSTMEESRSHADKQLINVDDGYYLPYHKKLGIFIIEK